MRRCLPLVGLLLLHAGPALAQKKPAAKPGPRVLVAVPLGVKPGTTTRLTLRGLKLDGAKEVRVAGGKATIKLLKSSKVGVPNQVPAERVGDTQVEAELKLSADFAGEAVELVVVTPAGESPPHRLLLDRTPLLAEKEPNNGFRAAQLVRIGQVLDGKVQQPQDVDVFRFEGKAGQRLVLEVQAGGLGSPLDAILTLYDAGGQVMASADDRAGSDPRIEATLPRDGSYYLVVIDAHDQGGPTHVYRLTLRAR